MSGRWASSTNETAAAAPDTPLRLLVDLDFASGHAYFHAGNGDIALNGSIYLGVGAWAGFEQVTEEAQVNPKPITLSLAGIPNEIIGTAMTEVYQGRNVVLWLGIIDPPSGQWIANPEQLWSGVMDVMTIEMGQAASSISLVCEDPDYAQPPSRRYTVSDHQQDFAGDTFFEYLAKIPGFKGNWGAPGTGYGYIGGMPTYAPPGGHPGKGGWPGVWNHP